MNELHDLLHAAVPEPPAAPDRAAGARDRARRHRRRTTAGVAVAAALVVAAVAAVPVLTSDDRPGVSRPTAPTPTPTPTPEPPVEAPCPAVDEPTHGPATVLEGAVLVRLCQGIGVEFDAPADALTTDVAAVAAAINDQPSGPVPLSCTMDLGRGYQLVFGYPDGHTQNVAGELYGCHSLSVGGTSRSDPEKPYRTFIRLLRAQRAASTPPASDVVRPSCGRGGFDRTSPVARPKEMAVGTLCVRYESASETDPVAVPVSAGDLEVLLHDWVVGGPPAYDSDAPTLLLVGATAWGDRVSLPMDQVGIRVPGPDAERILDRLVGRTGRPVPTIDASSTAEDVVAAYVDLLNADLRDEATALWHPLGKPDLPTGYSRIGYKVEGVRPLRFVSAYQDAVAVTGLYGVVPADGSNADYRETVFTLGRDDQGVFRIVNVHAGDVVETGR
jgi:hypothetical protein